MSRPAWLSFFCDNDIVSQS